MTQKIYTIGYQSLKSVSQLKGIAETQNALVADIRLVAYSPNPIWCTETMHHFLLGYYRHIPQLGNKNFKKAHLPIVIDNFEAGFKQIARFLSHHSILLVCACRQAEGCHRKVVAEMIQARTDCEVEHLLSGRVLQIGEELPIAG